MNKGLPGCLPVGQCYYLVQTFTLRDLNEQESCANLNHARHVDNK